MSTEKIALSKAENKLVVGIPPVTRVRPIVVQPETVFVAFQVENIRVAVAVSNVWRAIFTTARLVA